MQQFSKRVSAGSRVYFFDVHTDRKGSPYITISELTKATGGRSCIFLHTEDFAKFSDALSEAVAAVGETTLPNVKA